MWSLEKRGKGRRAVILSASNGSETYRVGDFVAYDDFVGVVAALKEGETENLHQVELLHFVYGPEEELKDELMATSLLKWHSVDGLRDKLEPKPHPKRAIGHLWHNNGRLVDLPRECDSDVHDFANYVASLFVKTPNSRKKAAKQPDSEAMRAEEDYDEMGFSTDDSDFAMDPDEDEMLPARKRSQHVSRVTSRTPSKLAVQRSPSKKTAASKSPRKMASRSTNNSKASFEEASGSDTETRSRGPNTPTKTRRNAGAKASPRKRAAVQEGPTPLSVPISLRHDDEADANSSSEEEPGNVTSIIPVTPRKGFRQKSIPVSPFKMRILPTNKDRVLTNLHPASTPDSFPCRDTQFDQLFYALESAIQAETGTCIYVSGTPGTGKTSTIKEVLGQLYLRVGDRELNPFTFLEINGMKLVHPNAAYEHLWEVMGNKSMAASNAMTALEAAFTKDDDRDSRGIVVVLLDELDQLVTKGQQLMYNFFNWPSLPHSRLIVIAVANTMDLPERVLSNKISSRVGLTRIQFPGYTQDELKSIVLQRLGADAGLIDLNAIEYVTRKVASVGGDARRVLDFTRKAIVLARAEARHGAIDKTTDSEALDFTVKVANIRDVIIESQSSPTVSFLKTLGVTAKVLLCAVLMRSRRADDIELPLHDVLKQARQLVRASANANELAKWLYPTGTIGNSGRIALFQPAVLELVEAGILVQQAIAGEATPRIRLMVPATLIRESLQHDTILKGML